MIVFTLIGIVTTIIVGGFFILFSYDDFMYSNQQFLCKILGHKIFNRNSEMHDYCLRCGK